MAYDHLNPNIKYYVEITEFGKEPRRFLDCTYQYYPERSELRIITAAGAIITFIGNFSAWFVSMEDYYNYFQK